MKNLPQTADCIIIGGGIIGCSIAYHCAKMGKKVIVIEKDYLGSGSTGRCIGGIRQQFSSETTVRIAMDSVKIFKEFGDRCEWYSGGYIFLAHSRNQVDEYKKAISLQKRLGLDVSFISTQEIEKIVPGIDTTNLLGGAYSPVDGQANPFLTLKIMSDAIKELGGKIHTKEEVVSIKKETGRVVSVKTNTNAGCFAKQSSETTSFSSGNEYFAPVIVNCAGAYLSEIGKMLGIEIPSYPERHEALITESIENLFNPMLVDYRAGGYYFIQRHETGQIIGCYTPIPTFEGKSKESSIKFLTEMPKRMIRFLPVLSDTKVLRQWAGSYIMTPDGNPILDKTEIQGFYVAGAMCGHGFMLGPCCGKLMAELIFEGKTSIDISEFSLKRKFKKKEIFK